MTNRIRGRQVPPHRSGGNSFVPEGKIGSEIREAFRVAYQEIMRRRPEEVDCAPADPYCYGCLGTGKIRWGNLPRTPCPCTDPENQEY